MDTIGDRIKKRREEMKISARDLATRIGISHVAVSKLETGLSKAPSAENLFAIADALKVSPQSLLFGEERYPSGDWARQAVIEVGEWPFTATLEQVKKLEHRDFSKLDLIVSSFVDGHDEEAASTKSGKAS